MRAKLIAAGLVIAASTSGSTSAWAQRRCMVSDPTGTPLNVRARPNGPIVGALYNGVMVQQRDTVVDARGRPWSLVEPEEAGRGGWVFREFVSCR